MKSAYFFRAVVVAVLLGLAVLAPAAEDGENTAEAYFRAFVLCNAGMKEIEAGHRERAVEKLKYAQTLIREIHESDPNWQSAMVAARLKRIEQVLKEQGSTP